MLIVNDTKELSGKVSRSVLTIGNFDGVHLGHQALIQGVIDRADRLDATSVVFTFQPHPLKVLSPEKCPPLIDLPEQQVDFFSRLNIDVLIRQNFSREFSVQSPRDFIELVLCKPLHPVEIFVGGDFRFGKGRDGDIKFLIKLSAELGYKVNIVNPITLKNRVISSTLIRALLADGKIDEATELLGRPYAMAGAVVHGDARGKELGFPTANINTENDIIPQKGVYAVKVLCKGRACEGIVNIGYRPTFGNNSLTIEAFLFDFNDDIYDQPIILEFISRLRNEKAFNGPEELVVQIKKDVAEAKRILSWKT